MHPICLSKPFLPLLQKNKSTPLTCISRGVVLCLAKQLRRGLGLSPGSWWCGGHRRSSPGLRSHSTGCAGRAGGLRVSRVERIPTVLELPANGLGAKVTAELFEGCTILRCTGARCTASTADKVQLNAFQLLQNEGVSVKNGTRAASASQRQLYIRIQHDKRVISIWTNSTIPGLYPEGCLLSMSRAARQAKQLKLIHA